MDQFLGGRTMSNTEFKIPYLTIVERSTKGDGMIGRGEELEATILNTLMIHYGDRFLN
jgi:hypothetical protein